MSLIFTQKQNERFLTDNCTKNEIKEYSHRTLQTFE